MKTFRYVAAASFAFVAANAPDAAKAQSIDYEALQQLFNEPVTTSATGSPQRSTEVPVDMTIITAEDIRRSGATDIPTILSRAAGIDILPFSSGASEISARGYNQSRSPRMLVLINGRQVYLDHFGYTDWYTLPVSLDEIRQIELVRGPNSALFGFNAVSGVVNIITYNPKYDDANSVNVLTGTQHHSAASLLGTFKTGWLNTRVSLANDRKDEWENHSTAITAAQLRNPETVRASIDSVATLGPKTDIRLEGAYSNSSLTEMLSGYTYVASRVKSTSLKATLNSDTPYGSVQVHAYENRLDSSALPLHYYNTIRVFSVQDLIKLGTAHTLRFAVEHRDNKVNTTPVTGGEVGYTVWAPSVMWNWQAMRNLAITAAVRQDSLQLRRKGTFPAGVTRTQNSDWDRSIVESSFNLGAVLQVTDVDTLRVTTARGVQAPTLVELGSRQVLPTTAPPTGIATLGNPTLRPAIITSHEVAYDRSLSQLGAHVSVKLFTQKTDDIKSGVSRLQIDIPATTTTYPAITYLNIGQSTMQGMELSAYGKFGKGFRWSADTTMVDIKDKPIAGYNPVLRLVAYSETTPKYRSNLMLGWTDNKWTVDGYVHRVSKFSSYVGSSLEAVPGYTSLSGRLAYLFDGNIELSLNGQNLLKERQMQAKGATGLQAERRLDVSLTKRW